MSRENSTGNDTRSRQNLFDDQDSGLFKDPGEQLAVLAALDSFHQYRKTTHHRTTHRRRQNLYALPSSQWQMLADPPISILDTLSAIDDAIDDNADLAEEIFHLGLAAFGLPEQPPKDSDMNWRGKAGENDMSKAHSSIRQFYRDWSSEGYKAEVEPLLEIIMSDLDALLPLHANNQASPAPSILLPGAGLGRLLFELCLRGYDSTGSEISLHQLLSSNFILNSTQRAGQYKIYPFATSFTNVTSRRNQLKAIAIPDIHPATALASRRQAGFAVGEMNMSAGDFLLSYSGLDSAAMFDAVISVFFVDTAPNLIRYIETIKHCLKPGGLWINIGPLLWHFDGRQYSGREANEEPAETLQGASTTTSSLNPVNEASEDKGIAEAGSFELSDEEVVQLVGKLGFEILKHELVERAPGSEDAFGYMQDPDSLLQSRYRCSHWVARRY